MYKSTFQSVAVLLLVLTAATGFSHAQSIKVPAVRRAALVTAPATVAPPVPVTVPAAHVAPAAAPASPVLACTGVASGVMGSPFTGLTITATGGTLPTARQTFPQASSWIPTQVRSPALRPLGKFQCQSDAT